MTDPFFAMLAADDPYPILHALRASEPVHFVEPLGFWLVTRHADIMAISRDPQRFAVQPEGHALDLVDASVVLVPPRSMPWLKEPMVRSCWPAPTAM